MIRQTNQGQSSRQSRFLISCFFVSAFLLLTCMHPPILAAAPEQEVPRDNRSAEPARIESAQLENQAAPQPIGPSGQLQQPAPDQVPPAAQTRQQKLPLKSMMTAEAKKGQVVLNFDDADVYSVIQTVFADILGQNYIIDQRVKGKVTFRTTAPVAVENVLPLMEVILRLNGIAIVEEGGLFRIIPMSDAPREPAPISYGRDPESVQPSGKALLQVVPIRYLQSSEMVKLITPFVSTNAVVVDVPKNNHIIIVDTDSNVKRLLKLVGLFDNEQQKDKGLQVFIYNVQNGKAKDMATLLQQIFLSSKPPAEKAPVKPAPPAGQQPQPAAPTVAPVVAEAPQMTGGALVSDSTKIYSDDILSVVIIVATAEDFATIKQTIDKIDVVPRQVLIEGIIAQVSLIDNMSLGLAWSLKGSLGDVFSSTVGFNLSSLEAAKTGGGSGFTFTGIDPGGQVRALISALATKSKAKLLAAPHLLVSDNREARIQVGQQVPIVTSETYGSSTIAPQRTIQYKDIGIILKVKPHISEGGLISIELSQEISTYETIKLFQADETQIILHKTDVTTNLVVQDNQTIIIGGLIREDTSAANTGIPWLNKIPILGYLFGNTADDNSKTEIVILLTPRMIKSIQDISNVTGEYVDRFSTVDRERLKIREPFGEKSKGGNVPEKNTNDSSKKSDPSTD